MCLWLYILQIDPSGSEVQYLENIFFQIVVQSLSHIWLCDPMNCIMPDISVIPSLCPWLCSNSCSLSQWYQPTISSSVVPFSSCPQSFLESGSFPMSRLFISDGQSTGASASASVLLMNILVWFPLGLTDLISWQSKSLSRVFSSTTVWKLQFFSVQYSSWSNSHIHLTIVYRTNWRGFRSEAERWRKRSLQLSGELQEAWTMADHREMDGCENDLEVEWTEPSDVRDSGWEKGRRHERPGFWPRWLELGSVCLHRDDTEEEECGGREEEFHGGHVTGRVPRKHPGGSWRAQR